jgi:hypothetical protein
MSMSRFKIAAGILLLTGLFVACDEPRELQTDNRTVAAGGAKTAEVELRMGAGELRLAGANQDALLEATFRYNRARLKPEVDYRVSGTTGILRIGRHGRSGISFGRTRNEWDLRLNKAIPLDLKINLGAGESRLDLRGLELSSLDINTGVGEMKLDLRGPHPKGFRVKIDGGVGSGTLYLPADVGVRVKVDGGIGSVNAHGLSKDHHVYTNDAYGKSSVTIDIEIDAGIGSLDLRVEPGEAVKL